VAQIVSSARLWPSRSAEPGRRQANAGDRTTRTRRFYLAASFAFAVVTYLAVQLIQAGGELVNAATTARDPLMGGILVHATSLVAWVSACMLAGLVAHRYLSTLGTTLQAESRRGEKLASLQHIVNLIVGRREGQHHRIAIDVENYRGRREEQLRDVADRAAKRVIQSGKIIQLEAMPAIERRVVHMALLENPKVRTQSVGVEPNRRIVVLPASQVRE